MSDLLLMSSAGGGGLPPNLRKGLVAWYDPWRQVQRAETGQTLIDYSGHGNSGTLGATDAVSTDDPAWTGNSLKFITDDYCLSPVLPFNLSSEFTVYFVSLAGNGGVSVCLANSGDGGYYVSARQYVNACTFTVTNSWASKSFNIPVKGSGYTNVIKLAQSSNALHGAVLNVGAYITGDKCTGNLPAHLSIGALARHVVDNFVPSLSFYFCMVYGRYLSPAEDAQMLPYIRRLMASRGVTIS